MFSPGRRNRSRSRLAIAVMRAPDEQARNRQNDVPVARLNAILKRSRDCYFGF
jgi:hypothetical protein